MAEVLKLEDNDSQIEFEVVYDEKISREDNDNQINAIDRELQELEGKLEKISIELDKYTNHADGVDYTIAIGCGLLTGLIDSFFGDKIKNFTDNKINNKVIESAKEQKIKKKIDEAMDKAKDKNLSAGELEEIKRKIRESVEKEFKAKEENGVVSDEEQKRILSKAIRYLEKNNPSPTDKIWNYKGSTITPESHHLDDLAHHPSIVGLIASILTQFTKEGYFGDSNGEFKRIKVDEKGLELIGETIPEKIVAGTLNWFWHLLSDVSGTSGKNAGSGMGIPGPLMSFVKELSMLPGIKDTQLPKLVETAFKEIRYDMRQEVADSIPVFVNTMLVRLMYSIHYLVLECKEKKEFSQINWKRIIPAGNRTITRMLTIATGTFVAVDVADAGIRAIIESGGINANTAAQFLLKINFVGVGRFVVACSADIRMEFKEEKIRNDRMRVMSEMIMLTNAKVYYRQSNMWMSAENAEKSMIELYNTMLETVQFYEKSVCEINESMQEIGKGMANIREKNPDLAKKMYKLLRR